ncbi:PRC-barrel domain-containing protein [Paucibacter sp. KCTC 42545]|uniref:PRC-barrel domain-containing protein n=1 Tax=Paucibacter sp. KCTC 42545 TaxID=1768242 RepID=UPI000733B18F|nr:PRC-barrel domain-containing protein [Paucibacter sp. KCTC 42545]ALT79605.1 photosystem reaction center subunit H [Paucibacter sp. KCTC 42545]
MNYEERDPYGMYRVNNGTGTDLNSQGNGSLYTPTHQGPGPRLMGANTLIGNDVSNQDGDDLGEIKEIMLDVSSGRISYAVLSFGGFLSMGEKLFAVPWSALKLDTVNKRFTVSIDKTRLESAPGFDKDQWPDMADPEWAAGIHAYYGTTPRAETLMN